MAPEARVSVLLDALSDKRVVGTVPATVRGLTADSRMVERGDCFVAVPGFREDARRFIPDAVARGAGLVVTEGEALPGVGVAQVLVPATRPALARLAAVYHGHPSRALTLVGITGTNGKTTTSYLVEAMLRGAGPTGILGTIQYVVGDEFCSAGKTMPESLDILAMIDTIRVHESHGVGMTV